MFKDDECKKKKNNVLSSDGKNDESLLIAPYRQNYPD